MIYHVSDGLDKILGNYERMVEENIGDAVKHGSVSESGCVDARRHVYQTFLGLGVDPGVVSVSRIVDRCFH